MPTKQQLVILSFTLAIVFHFIFYFSDYGPAISVLRTKFIYLPALLSAFIMIFLYFVTNWRANLKGSSSIPLFDLLVIWIFICLLRSMLKMKGLGEVVPFFFYNYLGISLFPVLFFTVGLDSNYYTRVNKILYTYIISATLISLFFLKYFEIQVFLLMPIFYLILTIPLHSTKGKILILIITIGIIVISVTNRAGIMRILISYCILSAYYVIKSAKINKKLIGIIVFIILLIPVVSLYFGIKGESVFKYVLGDEMQEYSQYNPYADTRTFLYYEVLTDLKTNNALIFGKGMNASYASEAFETFGRFVVEVGFLQILMKTGIFGVFLYLMVIISAIIKAIGRSNSYHMKSLGLLLSSYVLMLFIENVIAYNLLNVLIWIVIGMCHSKQLRALNDSQIKLLFNGSSDVLNSNFVK